MTLLNGKLETGWNNSQVGAHTLRVLPWALTVVGVDVTPRPPFTSFQEDYWCPILLEAESTPEPFAYCRYFRPTVRCQVILRCLIKSEVFKNIFYRFFKAL
jgi:hypothetical protein